MIARSKKINFGDRIFARVTRNGQTIYNFVSEKVSDMSDLLSQLRRAMKDFHGLVMIHIRNFNEGWGEERPLMLYTKRSNEFPAAETVVTNERSMFFPWETH